MHDEFLERADARRSRRCARARPATPASVDVGAIIFPPQIELIEAHVRDAVDKGARGGHRRQGAARAPGRFYEPTVLADVDHSMRCMIEETFGPTLPVMRVADAEEAIALANEGPYGLQASVWTRDAERGREARPPDRGRASRASTTRSSTTRRSSCRWAAGRPPGSARATAPTGSASTRSASRCWSRPGYAPARDAHMLPLHRRRSRCRSARRSRALAASDLFNDAQRRDAVGALRHLRPVARAAATARAIPTGFWARAASHLGVPEAIEIALLQAGRARRSSSRACASCSTRSPRRAWPPRPRRRPREAIVHAFTDSGPEALAGITALRGVCHDAFLRAAGPRHRPQPELGRDRLSRARSRSRPTSPKPLDDPPARRGAEEVIEADVCVVGSGAGGGVIAGELAAAGKQVCVLEMGGYHDESDFDQLELPAYQRLYLNGGPFPTAEGQVSIVAGAGARRRHGHQLDQLPAHPPRGSARSGRASIGLEGLDGADFDAPPGRRLGAARRQRRLQRPERAAPAAAGGLRGASATTSGRITRNADPATLRPGDAPATWASATSRARSARPQKTYLADAQRPRRRLRRPTAAAERILVEGGRAAGVEARLDRPRAGGERRRRASHGPRAGGRRRLRLDRVAGAAAALRDRRPRGRRLPAPAPDRARHRRLPDEPQNWWWGPPQAALSHEFADLERRLRLPDRVRRSRTTGLFAAALALALRARPQGADARAGAAAPAVHQPHPRPRSRPGDDRRRRQRRSPATRSPTSSTSRNFRRGLAELIRLHEAAGAERDRQQRPQGARSGSAATTSRRSSPRSPRHSLAPREYRHLLRPPDGQLPDGRRPADVGRRTRGASSTTRRASGSATRAPSRPPPAPTRWSRSWRWRAAPRRRSPRRDRGLPHTGRAVRGASRLPLRAALPRGRRAAPRPRRRGRRARRSCSSTASRPGRTSGAR